MLIKYYLDILAALISKAVWFLQLYISQYKELLIFIAVFVVLYIFFMHWLNVRFSTVCGSRRHSSAWQWSLRPSRLLR